MAEKLRFGIIGCGVIGPLHAEAIRSLPDAQLIAVADADINRARQLATQYQIAPYRDVQEMFAREQLNVVTVCTPSGMHAEHAIEAMRAGYHVILEKPMEINRERIVEMLHVQQETGRKLAVISQHRFDAATTQVHELIQQQAFGRLVLGNVLIPWWRSQKYYDSSPWRGTRALDGGGVLMNQGIHSIDLLQWLMGPVKSVYAYSDTLAHRMETEDIAVAVLRFANGALGTIAATTAAYPGTGTRIEIYGDKGSAVIDSDRLAYLHLVRDDQEEIGPYGGAATQAMESANTATAAQDPAALLYQSHALQIANMIQAIRQNVAPMVDGHAARHPVEIILSIYESARTKKEIMVPQP